MVRWQIFSDIHKDVHIYMQADKVDNPDTVGVLRTRQLALSRIEETSAQTSISRKVKMRKKFGLKETPNPILNPSLKADIYK